MPSGTVRCWLLAKMARWAWMWKSTCSWVWHWMPSTVWPVAAVAGVVDDGDEPDLL